MLLLVVQPEGDQGFGLRPCGVRRAVDQRRHGSVHVRAVIPHLVERGASDQAALRPGVSRPDRLIVGVEQEAERRVERPIAVCERLQQEGLEEPGGVREVPLDRTGVRHGLDLGVLRGQTLSQDLARRAHAPIGVGDGLAIQPIGVALALSADWAVHRAFRQRKSRVTEIGKRVEAALVPEPGVRSCQQ